MNLLALSLGSEPVVANEQGVKIPWDDPDFSRRMLENHLSQGHDWAEA